MISKVSVLKKFAALVLLTMSISSNAKEGQDRWPIIDAHVHAIDLSFYQGSKEGGLPINMFTGEKTPEYTNESLRDATFAAMDKYNIVRAVVSGTLEDVSLWKKGDPERIIAGVTIGGDYDVDFPILRKEIEAGRLDTLGELFSQYYGMPFDDPSLIPYYALAHEFDIPIGVHTGLTSPDEIEEYGLTEFRTHLGNPAGLEEVLVKFPGLKLVLQHGGLPFLQETIAIMSIYRSVYLDISSISSLIPKKAFHNFIEQMVDSGFEKRILFGTDVYLWPEEQFRITIESIESANFLSDRQKLAIFCTNAAVFLELDSKLCEMKSQLNLSEMTTEEKVRSVVGQYIKGTFEADAELLRDSFHEKAVMNGYLDGQLMMGDPKPFIDDITSRPSMKQDGVPYQADITHIEISGNVANVTMKEKGFGGKLNFVNYFQLLNTENEWKIFSKTFTTE